MRINGLILLGLLSSAAVWADAASDAAVAQADIASQVRQAVPTLKNARQAWLVLRFLELGATPSPPEVIAQLRQRVATERPFDAVLQRQMLESDEPMDGRGRPRRELAAEQPPTASLQRSAAVLAELELADPGNAQNGIVALRLLPNDLADPIYTERLHAIAQSGRYQGDFVAWLQAADELSQALKLVPTPAPAGDTENDPPTEPSIVMAFGLAHALDVNGGRQRLIAACKVELYPERAADCQSIARKLLAGDDTLIGQLLASALLRTSASDAALVAEAAAATRRTRWWTEMCWAIAADAGNQASAHNEAQFLQAMIAHGEIPAIREWLLAHQVALDPPGDWQPMQTL